MIDAPDSGLRTSVKDRFIPWFPVVVAILSAVITGTITSTAIQYRVEELERKAEKSIADREVIHKEVIRLEIEQTVLKENHMSLKADVGTSIARMEKSLDDLKREIIELRKDFARRP